MRALDSIPAPIRSIVEFVLTLVVAIALALAAQAYIVKPYRVPSESMVPTLLPGDRVLADRLTLRFRDPERGEIVVFHPPVASRPAPAAASAARPTSASARATPTRHSSSA